MSDKVEYKTVKVITVLTVWRETCILHIDIFIVLVFLKIVRKTKTVAWDDVFHN